MTSSEQRYYQNGEFPLFALFRPVDVNRVESTRKALEVLVETRHVRTEQQCGRAKFDSQRNLENNIRIEGEQFLLSKTLRTDSSCLKIFLRG